MNTAEQTCVFCGDADTYGNEYCRGCEDTAEMLGLNIEDLIQ